MIKWIGQHIFDFIARFRQGEIWMGNSNVNSKIEAESNSGTGKDLTIKAGSLDGTVADSTGGNLYLKSGLGSGTGYGGDVFIYGGNRGSGGSTSVNSEFLLATFDSNEFLYLGNSGGDNLSFGIQPHTRTTEKAGEHLNLFGGTAYGTNKDGGDIIFTAGTPTGSGDLGSIKIIPNVSTASNKWEWQGTAATCHATSITTGPELILESGNTTATNCGQLTFRKDTGVAPYTEDDEYLGQISFYGDDSGNTDTLFANILAQIKEVDNTDEAGKLTIQVATSDGSTSTLRNALYAEGSPSDDDVDVTIGHGSSSVVTVPGRISTNRVDWIGSAGITSVQQSSASFSDDDTSLMTSAAIDDRINAAGGGADEVVSTGNHILKQTKVTIDTAGFNGLYSTPQILVAAQGANTVIIPTEVVLFHDRASTQSNSVDLIVGFNGLTTYPTAVKYIRRYMQNVTTDRTMDMGRYAGNWANDLTTVVNSNLTIALSGTATVNCVTSLTVYTSYYVIDIS